MLEATLKHQKLDAKSIDRVLALGGSGPEEAGMTRDNFRYFASLSAEELARAASSLEEQTFAPGTTIVTQGEEGETFYIVKAGLVKVFLTGEEGEEWSGEAEETRGAGDEEEAEEEAAAEAAPAAPPEQDEAKWSWGVSRRSEGTASLGRQRAAASDDYRAPL